MKTMISFCKKSALFTHKQHAHCVVLEFFTLYFHDLAKDCIKKYSLHLSLGIGPEYVENISSRSLKKTSDQRELRQTKCLLSNF